jgi:hypothetical protein
MEYDHCGPIDAGNSGLERLLQRGKALMITTERGPANEVELQRQGEDRFTGTRMVRDDCSTHYVGVFLSML